MEAAVAAGDRAVVKRLLAGDRKSADEFFLRMGDVIWRACLVLARDEPAQEQIFIHTCAALGAENFQLLRAYDGRSSLATYVSLKVREILAQRVITLLREDRGRGWRAFEHFFKAAIKAELGKRLYDTDQEEDAYQEICAGLAEKDYHRICQYSGAGHFGGFVMRIVVNLMMDWIRRDEGRLRLPAAIEKLAALDQAVFKAIYWQGYPPNPQELLGALLASAETDLTQQKVADAIERVRAAVPPNYVARITLVSLLDPDSGEQVPLPDDGTGEEEPSLLRRPDQIVIANQNDALARAAYQEIGDAIDGMLSEKERERFRQLVLDANPKRGRPPAELDRRIVEKLKPLTTNPAIRAFLAHIRDADEE